MKENQIQKKLSRSDSDFFQKYSDISKPVTDEEYDQRKKVMAGIRENLIKQGVFRGVN